ncbi:MAG: hypothetical protein ACOCYO_02390, partial [Bacteroidota bacterium]
SLIMDVSSVYNLINSVRCLPRSFLTGELAKTPALYFLSMSRNIIIHVRVNVIVLARIILPCAAPGDAYASLRLCVKQKNFIA